MSLQPLLNKNSQAHIESKIDVLGVARKLVKYVVHLSIRKKERKKQTYFSSHKVPKYTLTTNDQFLGPRNFRG